ncbi:MAG TPA: AMIN domain-containing protein, partial [Steroidobacteraceae bacterium]|nr:AMIN domain-containing protein [Steroidobacteraceae bacterium]
MITKGFSRGFSALIVAVGGFSAAPAAELRGIALSASTDSAQVTLDLSDGTTQKLFTLDHPDRVVIDLPHT